MGIKIPVANALTPGTYYNISFDVTHHIGGTIKGGTNAGASNAFDSVSSIDSYNFNFMASDSGIFAIVGESGYENITIDNVSISVSRGTSNAGGCSQIYFDINGGESAFDLSTLMGTNGEPIYTELSASYNPAIGDITLLGDISAIAAGMVAYVVDVAGDFVTERYKIEAVFDPEVSIGMGLSSITQDVNVYVGGAFSTITEPSAAMDATSFNVAVYTNLNETVETMSTWASGTRALNTWIRFIGYNTQPDDMRFGGTYYQSIDDAYRSGVINPDSWTTWDRNNGDIIATLNATENLLFENIHFTNVSESIFTEAGTPPENTVFDHCILNEGKKLFNADTAIGTVFNDCFIQNLNISGGTILQIGPAGGIANCICEGQSGGFAFLGNGSVCNVLVDASAGGLRGIFALGAGDIIVRNVTIYGVSVNGIEMRADANIDIRNSIIVPLAKATDPSIAIEASSGGGDSVSNDYNCIWSVDGEPTEAQAFTTTVVGGTASKLGINSIIADPMFVDAANKDFRLKAGSPCLNTGKLDTLGGTISMGAWQRKSIIKVNSKGVL